MTTTSVNPDGINLLSGAHDEVPAAGVVDPGVVEVDDEGARDALDAVHAAFAAVGRAEENAARALRVVDMLEAEAGGDGVEAGETRGKKDALAKLVEELAMPSERERAFERERARLMALFERKRARLMALIEADAEGRRVAREDRLRALVFEEPAEQRKENLALNIAGAARPYREDKDDR